jgi:hypothetical protein
MNATFALLAAYSATDGTGHQKYIVGPMLWGAILLGVYLAGSPEGCDRKIIDRKMLHGQASRQIPAVLASLINPRSDRPAK